MAENRRILLVDDDQNFRTSMERSLRSRRFEITTADSAEAALKAAQGHEFELVITDVRMPGMDGFELATRLRATTPRARILMLTAFGSNRVQERSRQAGAMTWMEKPVHLVQLIDYIEYLFGDDGFAGKVRDVDLFDYLQLLHGAGADKVVEILSLGGAGRVYFASGQIVHAHTMELTGREALFDILSWGGGHFSELEWLPPPERTLDENTAYLLLEAARRRDEAGASLNSSGAVEVPSQAPKEEQRGNIRSLLQEFEKVRGVRGVLALGSSGLPLARAGELPTGTEALMALIQKVATPLGSALDVGPCREMEISLDTGDSLHAEPAGDKLVVAHLAPLADMGAVRRWLRDVAWRLKG